MTQTNDMNTQIDQLRTLRDEVRVKVHLAKMEARARWRELEPRVATMLEEAKHEAAADSREVVDDAIRALEQLRDSI